jgi:hypothetical protein
LKLVFPIYQSCTRRGGGSRAGRWAGRGARSAGGDEVVGGLAAISKQADQPIVAAGQTAGCGALAGYSAVSARAVAGLRYSVGGWPILALRLRFGYSVSAQWHYLAGALASGLKMPVLLLACDAPWDAGLCWSCGAACPSGLLHLN